MEQAVSQKDKIAPYLLDSLDYVYETGTELLENDNSCALRVCEWLYMQSEFSREDFTQYLGCLAAEYARDEDGIIGAKIASIVADCHMTELIQDVQKLYRKERVG